VIFGNKWAQSKDLPCLPASPEGAIYVCPIAFPDKRQVPPVVFYESLYGVPEETRLRRKN